MALVYINGRPYLYRSVRRDGRVTSEYVAGGESALLLAAAGRLTRDMRRLSLPEEREERRGRDDLEAALDDLVGRSRDLTRTAALCWFALRTAEAQHAAYLKSGNVSVALAEFRQRRINHTHRRFLSVVKTLATVRKLAVPTVQINVARNQVNVASALAAGAAA